MGDGVFGRRSAPTADGPRTRPIRVLAVINTKKKKRLQHIQKRKCKKWGYTKYQLSQVGSGCYTWACSLGSPIEYPVGCFIECSIECSVRYYFIVVIAKLSKRLEAASTDPANLGYQELLPKKHEEMLTVDSYDGRAST